MASEKFDDFHRYYTPKSEGRFPSDDPCWNSDWEDKLVLSGYKTIREWNSLGRVVKKGSTGIYLRCARKNVFNVSQTFHDRRLALSFIAAQSPKKEPDNTYHSKKDIFLLKLLKNDGRYIKTKSKTWIEGVVFKRSEESLFVLIRKTGIDIKFFNNHNGSFNEEDNKISFQKGFFIRINYSEEDVVVFEQAANFVKLFKKGCDITASINLVFRKKRTSSGFEDSNPYQPQIIPF